MRKFIPLFALSASLVFLFSTLAGLAMAGDPKPAKATIYRIRVEEGVTIPPGADAADIKAIEEINALLARWPNMLWLSNHRGKFVAMKMGPNGLPIAGQK